LGARIAIHRNVTLEQGKFYTAHPIAHANFAIAGRLSVGQLCAVCGEGQPAQVVRACERLAKVIRAAIRRDVAPDAAASSIADLIVSAARPLRVVRKHRRTIRARVRRARLAIIRKVGFIIYRRRTSGPIANDPFAIVFSLKDRARQRALALVRDFAFVRHAVAFFALGLDDPHAMTRRRTFDARTIAITNIYIAGRTSSRVGNVVIFGYAIVANVERARIVIFRDIGVVVDLDVQSVVANVELAIANNRRRSRRRNTIEVRIGALADRRVAQVVSARIEVFTIIVAPTGNFTNASIAPNTTTAPSSTDSSGASFARSPAAPIACVAPASLYHVRFVFVIPQ